MIETLAVLGGLIVITVVLVAVLRRWADKPEPWESKLDDVIKKRDKATESEDKK